MNLRNFNTIVNLQMVVEFSISLVNSVFSGEIRQYIDYRIEYLYESQD